MQHQSTDPLKSDLTGKPSSICVINTASVLNCVRRVWCYWIYQRNITLSYATTPINSSLNAVMYFLTPFGVIKAVGLPQGPSCPGYSPHSIIFCLTAKGQHSVYLKPVAFFFSSPASFWTALLFSFFLTNGNVHSNPDSVFSCSVCALKI